MNTDLTPVPVVINIVVIIGFVMIGMVIFHHWEEWDMPSAAYFSFITLTTIGFGDYVPNKSFELEAGGFFTFKMIGALCYCVIGQKRGVTCTGPPVCWL